MPLRWIAVYRDGTSLASDDAPSEQIDRGQVVRLALVDAARGYQIVVQHLEPGWRLIYRRRTELRAGQPSLVAHLLGWQQTVAGRNVQHVSVVFEDDGGGWHVENIGRWREDHPWFYPIAPVPADSNPVGGG